MNAYHGANSGKYRKAAKIDYPAAYAPSARTDKEAHQFNCAQRSHANFIENQPTAVAAMLLAGLEFPIASAVLGAGWIISRYLYMVGYSRGDKGGKGRAIGFSFFLFQFGLIGLAGYKGIAMIMGW